MTALDMTSEVERAWREVCIAHGDQVRKYTGEPYVDHVWRVAALVNDYLPGPADKDAIVAALCHDVIEDTHLQLKDVFLLTRGNFNVTLYVRWLTDDYAYVGRFPNRATRKELIRNRLAYAPDVVKAIKCADIADNSRSIASLDPDFARVYLDEQQQLLDTMCPDHDNPTYGLIREHAQHILDMEVLGAVS